MPSRATIRRRPLGRTGVSVSELAFGCGPISKLMTVDDVERQAAVLAHALDRGLNWIDTAATYGRGQSERSIGAALAAIGRPEGVHVATKVRLRPERLGDIARAVRESVEGSLERLGVSRVTLLQLHNAITERRGDEETSITPADVLGSGGVLDVFTRLRDEGLAAHLGLTAVGHGPPLGIAVESGGFDTIQVPYNLANPSAGVDMDASFEESDYRNVIARARARDMGVLAIRVFAAGALLGHSPSPYTEVSKFFTLDLYRRDLALARELRDALGEEPPPAELALRFTLGHPGVDSAIVGFGQISHVDAAIESAARGPLPPELLETVQGVLELRGVATPIPTRGAEQD